MSEHSLTGAEIDQDLLLYIQKRRRLSLLGGGSIFVIFSALVMLISFFPTILSIPLGAAPGLNLGMLLAFLVLMSILVITGLYVRQSNRIDAAQSAMKPGDNS